jgi:flavin reductase (DIM6/NTAB) family NADH-FMN oxidoreductase RutF
MFLDPIVIALMTICDGPKGAGVSESSPELRMAFTDAFRRRGDSVAVVTYLDNHGHPGGMTATSITSVSADPPMLLVCVNRSAATHAILEMRGEFGVAFLSEGQDDISNVCAVPGEKNFPEGSVIDPESLTPRIVGAAAHLRCVVVDTHEHGTHTVFVARVTTADSDPDKRPLLYHDGHYHSLAD